MDDVPFLSRTASFGALNRSLHILSFFAVFKAMNYGTATTGFLWSTTIFFTTSAFHQQFLELCVTSYPSPLEESAPWPDKLLLLAIAGIYEYITGLRDFDVICTFALLFCVATGSCRDWLDSHYHSITNIALVLLFTRNFARRARAFAQRSRRHGRGATTESVLAAFVLHNPALVCHVIFRLWVHWVGMPMPPRWLSTSPMVVVGFLYSVSNETVVKHTPMILASVALKSQSRVFTSTLMERTSRRQGLDERELCSTKLSLRRFISILQQVLVVVESVLAAIISSTLNWTMIAVDMISVSVTNRCYLMSSSLSTMQYLTSDQILLLSLLSLLSLLVSGAWSLYLFVSAILELTFYVRLDMEPFRTSFRDQIFSPGMRDSSVFHRGMSVYRIPAVSAYRHFMKSPRNSSLQDLAVRPTHQIRLLTILPSACDSEVIQTLLQWCPISNTPSYTAISYSWNPTHELINDVSTASEYEIEVNGDSLGVTQSAYAVLRRMRSRLCPRVVWIDAICINQKDNADKDRQIPLMPQIYAQADSVAVWLGHSDTAYLATALVNRLFIVNRMSRIGPDFKYEINVEAAKALKDMLERRWFGRTWVVQEVVRAREGGVTVYYGDSRMDWTRLSWFMQCLSRDQAVLDMLDKRIGSTGLGAEARIALENVELMRRFSLLQGRDSPSLTLLFYLLQMFRSKCRFESKEQYDRVYALLGLREGPSAGFTLNPEYRTGRGRRWLYEAVIAHHLDTSPVANRLDFLPHAGMDYSDGTPGLPSWVPDWSAKPTSQPFFGTDGSAELMASPRAGKLLDDTAAMGSVVYMEQNQRYKDLYEASLNERMRVKEHNVSLLFSATEGTEPNARILKGSVLEVHANGLGRITTLGARFEAPQGRDDLSAARTLGEWIRSTLNLDEQFRRSGSGSAPLTTPPKQATK